MWVDCRGFGCRLMAGTQAREHANRKPDLARFGNSFIGFEIRLWGKTCGIDIVLSPRDTTGVHRRWADEIAKQRRAMAKKAEACSGVCGLRV